CYTDVITTRLQDTTLIPRREHTLHWSDRSLSFRHVMLPKDIAKMVPKTHLMSETEWRNLGVQQSQGWVHYMIHEPEPHILLFRRPLPDEKP
ncbi:cyclin-dependent kinases regulatory subunit 1, partial [Mixophyes fleayi]|uniref:cyclin-dependent kinases regulatory subunit 1 n=1 Tax=Mixophyes fleayi TaxID=3061075 RepID=UPI003F4E296D